MEVVTISAVISTDAATMLIVTAVVLTLAMVAIFCCKLDLSSSEYSDALPLAVSVRTTVSVETGGEGVGGKGGGVLGGGGGACGPSAGTAGGKRGGGGEGGDDGGVLGGGGGAEGGDEGCERLRQ